MKVMCISNSWYSMMYNEYNNDGPKYGEVCTVVSEICDAYILNEYPKDAYGGDQAFSKPNFIPLSSIDETTFQRNYKKETV